MLFFFNRTKDNKIKTGSIEHAYLVLLNNELESAYKIFQMNDSPRGRWGASLSEICKGNLFNLPTYFEIRNFLEIDLEFLLKNKKIDYIEMLLGILDDLYNINNETYKYVAKVFLEFKLYNACKKYLDKSKNVFFKDPELHFLYAKYYYINKKYKKSLDSINECLQILPEYFPAIKFKKELNNILKSNRI